MPKYLISANYTAEGMDGVRAAGAKSRVDAVSTMLEAIGGRLESMHFAFGDSVELEPGTYEMRAFESSAENGEPIHVDTKTFTVE